MPKTDKVVRLFSIFQNWPFFFEEISSDRLLIVSATGVRYAALLKDKMIPRLQVRMVLQPLTFMQDGALPDSASSVMPIVRTTFKDTLVLSRFFHREWPTRLPDLTRYDFSLWTAWNLMCTEIVLCSWPGCPSSRLRDTPWTEFRWYLWLGILTTTIFARNPQNVFNRQQCWITHGVENILQ